MGFYDAKGNWCNDGEGFYDSKGCFRRPGEGFYDSRGYFRRSGEGFYDGRGNWVSPGGAFYDGRGYFRSCGTTVSTETEAGDVITEGLLFLLFVPIAAFGIMATALIEWIVNNFHLTFIGFSIINALVCFGITKLKRHKGKDFILSFIGNYMCILSFVYIVLAYAVPSVIKNGANFDSILNFVIVLAFGFGGIAIIQFFNYYHEKAFLEFVLGLLYFVVVMQLIKNGINGVYTVDGLAELYDVKDTIVLKILFQICV